MRQRMLGVRAILGVMLAMSPGVGAAQANPSARVDSIFAEWNASGRPGASVAVLKDGEIVLERGYGSAQLEYEIPITPSTVFHVASVTKQFTAAGIVLLAQRGALSLEDDIRAHLPELPDLGRPVTVRQLIHHTSGIRDQWELLTMAGWRMDDVITKEHILRMMGRQRELNFEPGSEHLYSNMGYTLLAEIVERVGAKPFPAWMKDNVFDPLGMSRTHLHDDHQHVVRDRAYSYGRGGDGEWRNAVLSYANAGATSLFTTAGDLARWLRNYETGQVGGPGFATQMRERGVLNNGDTIPYAFAIVRGQQRGRTTWSHGGADAGFRSIVLHIPEARLGVVVLSNEASFNPGRLAAAVADVYLGGTPPVVQQAPASPTAAAVVVPPRLLDAYAGLYDVMNLGPVRLVRRGTTLAAEVRGETVELAAESDSTFRAVGPALRIRVTRANDEVSGILLLAGGQELRGTRLRAPPLTPADLERYAGSYYSPELDTVYRIVVEEGRLVARHQRNRDIPLTVTEPDVFSSGAFFFRTVRFTRSDAGAIDGFRLTGGRVRDLRFERVREEG